MFQKALMGLGPLWAFLYTFYMRFKPQYSLVLVSYAFMGFRYRFYKFCLHLRLG